jgi:hypothetical protein
MACGSRLARNILFSMLYYINEVINGVRENNHKERKKCFSSRHIKTLKTLRFSGDGWQTLTLCVKKKKQVELFPSPENQTKTNEERRKIVAYCSQCQWREKAPRVKITLTST